MRERVLSSYTTLIAGGMIDISHFPLILKKDSSSFLGVIFMDSSIGCAVCQVQAGYPTNFSLQNLFKIFLLNF
jgi:hypothetical protein